MNDPLDDDLDARLRAAFPPPSPQQLAATARGVVAGPAAPPRWPWLLAAAVSLLTIGLWAMRPARGPEGHDGAQLGAMWAAAYEDAETSGFRGTCCDADSDFGIVCEKRFAVKLAFGGASDVTLHGCYCGLPTGGCVAVLAMTGDGPTGVFIVPRAQDPRPCLPAGSPLHLARRELGPLVLYAVSRTPSASSLEPFRIAP
jgi:hypothetical protein